MDERIQMEKDLSLHLAAMFERMEWENTLPEVEKSKRRLPKMISQIPDAAILASAYNMPSVLLGTIERVIHHCRVIWGDDCFEKAAKERHDFFHEGEDDETNHQES